MSVDYRTVWRAHTGLTIPEGWHVHHIDGDRENNDPVNLMCVSSYVHWCIHFLQGGIRKLNGSFIQGAVEAGKKNAQLNFTPERQKQYAHLGPQAQLDAGTHLSQIPGMCSKGAKKCAELGKSGFKLRHVQSAGGKAAGALVTLEHLSKMGKLGGKKGGTASAKSPNSVNKHLLKCCDHSIIGTLPGMKRYHKNCNLVEVAHVSA